MVEMLGVLAIVGVLSVAGIAGYTTAMNAHRANKAINRMMRLAVVVSGQKLLGQTASISGEDADNVTLTEDTANGKFTLKISGLSEPVRTKISNMDVATAELSTDAQGNLAFTFNNDLGETRNLVENTRANFEGKEVPSMSSPSCYAVDEDTEDGTLIHYMGPVYDRIDEETGEYLNFVLEVENTCFLADGECPLSGLSPCNTIY